MEEAQETRDTIGSVYGFINTEHVTRRNITMKKLNKMQQNEWAMSTQYTAHTKNKTTRHSIIKREYCNWHV